MSKVITLEQFPFKNYDLKNLQFLGAGSYGKVYKSKNLSNGEQVAIKQINLQKIKQQNLLDALNQQLNLMNLLKSQHTVQLIQSKFCQNYTYAILQLCDSDLRKKMEASPNHRLKLQQVIKIFSGIMNGFKILVQNSCIHRDIKPENILIKGEMVKIGDFGFARKADLLCYAKYQQFCGTPIYMAPQLLAGQPYTTKCDIWSLGLLLYEMVYGSTPWPLRSVQTYEKSIRQRPLLFPYDIKVGAQLKDFIKKSLAIQEKNRMNWQQAFFHPFVKDRIIGQLCITKPVQPKIRLILEKMQVEAERKFVNQLQIFKKYQKLQYLGPKQFESLLKELNPTITTYQVNVLFETCDVNKNNKIETKQFQDLFCTDDYKSDPQTQRYIDQFVSIITQKQIQLKTLFQKFDKNNSKALDFYEFKNMIQSVIPAFKGNQINFLLKRIDKNKSGVVQFNQFIKQIGGSLATQKNYIGFWKEKAQRNMRMLKFHLNQKKLSSEAIMKMVDLDADNHIDRKQFHNLLTKINFAISHEQIEQIFRMVDVNNSQKISMYELMIYVN